MMESKRKFIRKSLKIVFKSYRTMTPPILSKLNALGFSIERGRKHIKIYFGNDRSHCVVVPSTASDVKAGINIATRVFRTLVVPQIS